MKRLILLLVALFILIAIPLTVYIVGQKQELRKKAAPATTLSLVPASLTKKVGDTFSLNVTIDTAANQVVAAEIHLVFDPTKFEALSITNGPLFPNVLASGVVDKTGGSASITVGATSATAPVSGTGTVAVLQLKALSATTSPASVRFAQDTFAGALEEGASNVIVGSTPANITITGDATAGNPPPSPPPSFSSPPASPSAQLTPTPTATTSAEASSSALTILSPSENEDVAESQPLIQGKAAPGASVTITIYSTVQTTVITADANGNWSYTPQSPLADGPHNVVASTQDASTGATYTATSNFVVAAGETSAGATSAMPVAGNISTTLIVIGLGIFFIISGIILPLVR